MSQQHTIQGLLVINRNWSLCCLDGSGVEIASKDTSGDFSDPFFVSMHLNTSSMCTLPCMACNDAHEFRRFVRRS